MTLVHRVSVCGLRTATRNASSRPLAEPCPNRPILVTRNRQELAAKTIRQAPDGLLRPCANGDHAKMPGVVELVVQVAGVDVVADKQPLHQCPTALLDRAGDALALVVVLIGDCCGETLEHRLLRSAEIARSRRVVCEATTVGLVGNER